MGVSADQRGPLIVGLGICDDHLPEFRVFVGFDSMRAFSDDGGAGI